MLLLGCAVVLVELGSELVLLVVWLADWRPLLFVELAVDDCFGVDSVV